MIGSVASCTRPTEDRTYSRGMCRDWELNSQPYGAGQRCSQPNQQYQGLLDVTWKEQHEASLFCLFLSLGFLSNYPVLEFHPSFNPESQGLMGPASGMGEDQGSDGVRDSVSVSAHHSLTGTAPPLSTATLGRLVHPSLWRNHRGVSVLLLGGLSASAQASPFLVLKEPRLKASFITGHKCFRRGHHCGVLSSSFKLLSSILWGK